MGFIHSVHLDFPDRQNPLNADIYTDIPKAFLHLSHHTWFGIRRFLYGMRCVGIMLTSIPFHLSQARGFETANGSASLYFCFTIILPQIPSTSYCSTVLYLILFFLLIRLKSIQNPERIENFQKGNNN